MLSLVLRTMIQMIVNYGLSFDIISFIFSNLTPTVISSFQSYVTAVSVAPVTCVFMLYAKLAFRAAVNKSILSSG